MPRLGGSATMMRLPSQEAAAMIGPGIAGLLTGGVSFTPILLFAGGCTVFSILLVSLALALGKSQADRDLVADEGVGQTS